MQTGPQASVPLLMASVCPLSVPPVVKYLNVSPAVCTCPDRVSRALGRSVPALLVSLKSTKPALQILHFLFRLIMVSAAISNTEHSSPQPNK